LEFGQSSKNELNYNVKQHIHKNHLFGGIGFFTADATNVGAMIGIVSCQNEI
jgi:hypothetical protein